MTTRKTKSRTFAFGLAAIIALAPIAAEAQFGRPVLPNPRENPENSGGGTGNLRSREGAPVLGQDRAGYSGKRKTVKRSTRHSTQSAKRKTNTETTGTVRQRPATDSMDNGSMNSGSMNSGTMNNGSMNSAPAAGQNSGTSGPAKAPPTGPNAAPQ